MKKITLWLFALFSCWQISAQVSGYSFSQEIGTFTQNSASATAIAGVRADTFLSTAQPIGFDFAYDGVTYTQFKMDSNGNIRLNVAGTGGSLTTNDLSTANATSRPIIAPLWDDLDGGDIASSLASYEVTGVAPNRVLTVEWKNWQWNYNATTNPVISFQVKLYETTNVIEFVYRGETGAIVSGSATIGIGSASGSGAGSYLNLTSVTTPAVSSTTSTTNINTKPVNGQVFRFSPPLACDSAPVAGTVAPASQTLALGQASVALTVTGNTSGVSALSYQWEESFDGVDWNNATGGTGSNTLTYTPPAFAGTTIMYRLSITCTATDEVDFSTIATLNSCSVVAAPMIETFTTFMPTCWSRGDNGDLVAGPATFGASSWIADGPGNVGTTGAIRINLDATGDNDWIISPEITIPLTSHQLKFDASAHQWNSTSAPTTAWEADDFVQVLVSLDGTTNWAILYTYNSSNVPPNTPTANIIDLGDYLGETVRFAFRGVEGATDGGADIEFIVDNFEIRATPNCPDQTGLVVGSITSSGAQTSWNNMSAEGATGYEYAVTTSATPPASGTATISTFYSASGLAAQTTHYLHVRASCAGGAFGNWATTSFTTPCASLTSFVEGFESTTGTLFPSCWAKVGASGTANSQASTAISGARNLYMYSSSSTSRPVVAMVPVSNANAGTHRMVMKVRGNFSAGETIELGYLTNPTDATTFVSINSIVTNSATVPQTFTTIPSTSLPAGDVVFALRTGTALLSVLIDDITWEQLPACPDPIGLVVGNITSSGADTSWTDLSGSGATGYEYAVTTSATPPTSGMATTNPFYPATGLAPNTLHYLHVRATCTGDTFGIWASTSFTTLCTAVTTLPYTENFDTYGTGSSAFPSCWARPVINSGYPSIVAANPVSTPNSLRFQSAVGVPTYAISPAFAEDINNLRVKFSLKREGPNSGTIDIGVLSNPSDLSTFEVVQTINPVDNNHTAYVFNLDGTTLTGANNYIALRHNSILGNWYYWVDNFVVELIPACPDATGLVVANINSSGADTSWDDMGANGATGYEYAVTTSATPPATGTATTATFYVATGLASNTLHYLHVRVACTGGDFGGWISTPFTTACAVITALPHLETFSTFPPTCWLRGDNGDLTAGPATFGSSSWVADGFGNVGSTGAIRVNLDATGDNDWIISPLFQIPSAGYELKFDASANQWASTSAPTTAWEPDDFVEVLVSTGTTNWTILYTYNNTNVPSNTGTANVIDLSAYAGQTVRFAYRGVEGVTDGGADIEFIIDNFEVRLTPTCPDQTGLVVANVTSSGADTSWDSMTASGATGYEYAVTTSATPPASGTATTDTFYVANGLTGQTVYYLHVRATCGSGLFGNWATISFSTPPTNDTCAGATALTVGPDFATNQVAASLIGASTTAGLTPSCQALFSSDVWYTVTVPASGNVTIETQVAPTNTLTDTVIAVYDACGGTQIICDDDSGPAGANNFMSIATVTGRTPGETLYVAVWKYAVAAPTPTSNAFLVSAYDCSSFVTPPTGSANQTYCTSSGDTLASLDVTGTNLVWYDAATAGNVLPSTTVLTSTTYYVASNNGTCDSVRIAITTTEDCPSLDFVNLQWPGSVTITEGESATVYGRVYEAGLTDTTTGQAPGIQAWVGYSSTNSNPNTWTDWVLATFNVEAGNDDEYQAQIGSTLTPGTYYYATRFNLNSGAYVYGGINATNPTSGGNFWDGTGFISGVLTVEPELSNNEFSFANLKLYPNPTKNILYISHTQEISNVEIYNLIGQKVTSMQLNANEGQINMSNLASGAYFVKVTSNNASKTVKVIRE